MRLRALDLFCGAGGAAKGYHDGFTAAGFDVEIVGVDIKPQPNYPYTFVQFDAMDFPLDDWYFDFIHASPPCQTWTAYRRRPNHVGEYPELVSLTRARLAAAGVQYVIENVPGAPLHGAVQLCGSSFGLDVRRHRLFETSCPVMVPPCDHGRQLPRFPAATNRTNLRKTVEVGVWRIPLSVQRAAMGIDWMTLEELSEAIPPAYTAYLAEQLAPTLEGIAA